MVFIADTSFFLVEETQILISNEEALSNIFYWAILRIFYSFWASKGRFPLVS